MISRRNPVSRVRSPDADLLLGIKPLVALLAAALLCAGAFACGASNEDSLTSKASSTVATSGRAQPSSASRTARGGGYLESDKDEDPDDEGPPLKTREDNLMPLAYGKEAGQTDKQAITALVKRYYTAAAAGDGAEGCSLLYSTLATVLGEGQSPPSQTCAAAISQVFKQQHKQLAADEVATMVVVDVRVKGNLAVATVGFRTQPVGRISLKREQLTWKINTLIDTGTT
jgi:ketosteroid isomerase-like protein